MPALDLHVEMSRERGGVGEVREIAEDLQLAGIVRDHEDFENAASSNRLIFLRRHARQLLWVVRAPTDARHQRVRG
ncbi:MAG: hypothetical protein R3D44_06030 [Hyphomicrobiaceae bacterium]